MARRDGSFAVVLIEGETGRWSLCTAFNLGQCESGSSMERLVTQSSPCVNTACGRY